MTSMRAERGYTTSVVILRGKDAAANEIMFKQRSRTDYILLSLPVWPDRLTISNVWLTTRVHLGDMLNALRGRVSTLSVNVRDVLDFYSDITKQFMYWLLVMCQIVMKFVEYFIFPSTVYKFLQTVIGGEQFLVRDVCLSAVHAVVLSLSLSVWCLSRSCVGHSCSIYFFMFASFAEINDGWMDGLHSDRSIPTSVHPAKTAYISTHSNHVPLALLQ